MSNTSIASKEINIRMSVRLGEKHYRQTNSLSEATGVTVFRNGIPKRDFDKAVDQLRAKMAKTSRVTVINDGMSRNVDDQYIQLVRDNRLSLDDVLAQDEEPADDMPF